MKKHILGLFATLFFVASVQAQTGFGLKAGLNLPKLTVSGGSGEFTSDASTSFYVTGYGNFPTASNITIQPGVSLQGKGGTQTFFGVEGTASILSLEIPVNIVYNIPTGVAGSLFVGAGPYVGFHLSGHTKVGSTKTDLKFGSEPDEFKAVDYGVNFLGGYKLNNGILLHAGYGLGLANLGNTDNMTIKNSVLSFGVGFEF